MPDERVHELELMLRAEPSVHLVDRCGWATDDYSRRLLASIW